MTALENLELKLYDKKILIKNTNMPFNIKIVSIYKGEKVIFVDKKRYVDSKELHTALLHESFHWDNPKSFYNFNMSQHAIQHRETRLQNKMLKEVLPCEKLKQYLREKKTLYEIADELYLTEEYVKETYDYYNRYSLLDDIKKEDDCFGC